jgi:phosphoribosyl-AMP cyclohydrolase
MGSAPQSREETTEFQPRFGPDGLIAAIVTDAETGQVVMFAWMNAEALDKTLATGKAHYWSRSRAALWQKGETSGNVQAVREIRVDCDQDALWLSVETGGAGVNCHTGRKSCFYRQIRRADEGETRLVFD